MVDAKCISQQPASLAAINISTSLNRTIFIKKTVQLMNSTFSRENIHVLTFKRRGNEEILWKVLHVLRLGMENDGDALFSNAGCRMLAPLPICL